MAIEMLRVLSGVDVYVYPVSLVMWNDALATTTQFNCISINGKLRNED
jgi:hypothetical protein